jgi:hypothetical protein
MQVDIVGRIRNLQLPVTQPLIPLFECLVNSIEAIEDAGVSNGRIDVYLEREARQVALAGNEETALAAIRDVTIVDNGAGFPANISRDQLDVELYKAQKDIELEHRQRAAEIRKVPLDTAAGSPEYSALYKQYLDEENELGKAALAKYVVHRRTILEMLETALKVQDSGSYAREDLVHSLIYPMRTDSEDVEFSRQNLWVVDERLAYHSYLASDLPMTRLKAGQRDRRRRARPGRLHYGAGLL